MFLVCASQCCPRPSSNQPPVPVLRVDGLQDPPSLMVSSSVNLTSGGRGPTYVRLLVLMLAAASLLIVDAAWAALLRGSWCEAGLMAERQIDERLKVTGVV